MTLHIGDAAPDFTAETTTGTIMLHDWIGKDWVFFFSHPGDFTPVCTTEIGRTAQLAPEFARVVSGSWWKFPSGVLRAL